MTRTGAVWTALALVGCSGGSARAHEDARRSSPVESSTDGRAAARDAAVRDAGPPLPAAPTTGDVQVRVEWIDVPPVARSSPGMTACATPRAAAVAPSTTWGIGDVLVLVDGAPSVTSDALVRWSACALTPRLAGGGALVVDSGADRPAEVRLVAHGTINAHGEIDSLGADAGGARLIQLPIAGHAVTTSLTPGHVYELVPAGAAAAGDGAWLVGGAGAVTDAAGMVVIAGVAPGIHAVRAWLPPRGGQPARRATGEVTVVAGELAELTLRLAP